MMQLSHFLTSTALALCLTAAPCLAQSTADAAEASTGANAPARAAPTDPQISDAVDDELFVDPAVPSARIDVSTANGIVTLTGSVDNLLAKERATSLAEAVRGVRGVINRIQVTETTRSNRSIRSDIDDALVTDPATESFDVIVDVAGNGAVTLTGAVESYAERELAETVAKGVRGVRSLENSITVTYDTQRPDSEITSDIRGQLRWNRFVDDGLIAVECENGQVSLSGVVGSAFEQQQARAKAWVAGVKSVDVADLKVERWARDDDLRGDKYVAKSDADVRQAIEDAMLYDPRVASFNVRTQVENGIATLRGKVDNLKARRAAEQDARNCVGVWSVDNRLKVRPVDVPTDTEIENDVERALMRDPWVEEFEISVTVDDGTVSLLGDVDTKFERARADDVASRVPGVVAVDNHLDIDETDVYRYDPYVDTWYSPTYYDWYYFSDPVVTTRSDTEIWDDIRDELWWSPFVDSDEVTVTVTDGVATLTGEVDSLSESMSATENAYEGGAVHVINDLKIDTTGQ